MDSLAEKTIRWLALYLTQGLGNVGSRGLLARFGTPEAVFEATYSDLIRIEGIHEKVARNIVDRVFAIDPEEEMRRVDASGARLIPYADPEYPAPLKEIYDPPVLLYAKGEAISREALFVGVVGSRGPTHYGLRAAERIGKGLAMRGAGVASGLARGIDAAAHWGCLSAEGATIAVLGTGIDITYPSSNRKLYEKILESGKGTLITEFPMGTPPEPRNFPIRNRIISGISRGIVVVEATRKSGSLITASLALEQGRDVFAVPGSVESFKSMGCHFLIKQGAKLVENADDVLDEFGFPVPDDRLPEEASGGGIPIDRLSAAERVLVDIIGTYPMHVDAIVRMSKMETGAVLSALMQLELKGAVRQTPGMMFAREFSRRGKEGAS